MEVHDSGGAVIKLGARVRAPNWSGQLARAGHVCNRFPQALFDVDPDCDWYRVQHHICYEAAMPTGPVVCSDLALVDGADGPRCTSCGADRYLDVLEHDESCEFRQEIEQKLGERRKRLAMVRQRRSCACGRAKPRICPVHGFVKG